MEKFKLPVHEHPLYRVGGNQIHGNSTYGWLLLGCDGCHREGHMDDGYRCSQCPVFYLHKKCGESAPEINHPSHPEHPLKLLAGPQCRGKRCHLCGINLELLCYHCSICDFNLDTGCAIEPPLPIIEQPKAHEHTLTLMSTTDTDFTCHLCGGNSYRNMYFYLCSLCDFFVHIGCVSFSPEISYPSHPRHPLKFVHGSSVDPSGKYVCNCSLCGVDIKNQSSYHCSICNFTVDLCCVKNPPPVAFVSPKTHKHELTLMPRNITFICNACGTEGDRSPYVCSRCNFMIHWYCVDLPGVIRINRHDHPLSHTYDHDFVNSSQQCGVCRKTMDSSYGAYSCSKKCKNYAVHSRCATKTHVWDGRDIEGEPEEIEDVAPFKVIGDNLITHFTHEEHDRKLMKGGSVNISCKACIAPIGSETFYECMQCHFILHERCANLPRKKRHVLLPEKFVLVGGASYFHETFRCPVCERYSSGFRYRNGPYEIDLQCISTTEPLKREAHHHPLYFFSEKTIYCKSCYEHAYCGFECLEDQCRYNLHFKCAIFPERLTHKSDDHTLRLYYPRGLIYEANYWCDICEKRVDYAKPYYTCDECGTTLHIKCVLGDLFGSISPGSIITHQEVKYNYDECWEYEFEVISNIGIVRPLCCVCHSRCTFSLVLKTHDNLDRYVCSYDCVTNFHPTKNYACISV